MRTQNHSQNFINKTPNAAMKIIGVLNLALLCVVIAGCGTTKEKKKDEFFTSGNRAADQRASQRMAKARQLEDLNKSAGDEKANGAETETKRTLYQRLGGEAGVGKIVDDFLARALEDPRVNWQRKGVVRGGFSFHRNRSMTWNASQQNVAQLKKHMAQFFALATGGPARYDGKEMHSAHAHMHITNAQFDAAVGDLKASLDKLKIPDPEQKELLAIVESTRPQIVEER